MELFSIKNWSDELGEIGLFTKSVRYGGGIYAHIDIAFEFASWISPEFKLSDKRNRMTRAINQQIDNVLVIVQQPVAQFVVG